MTITVNVRVPLPIQVATLLAIVTAVHDLDPDTTVVSDGQQLVFTLPGVAAELHAFET